MSRKILQYFFLMTIVQLLSANYFCELSCKNVPNTACSKNQCSASPSCGRNVEIMPFDDESRMLIVNLHNQLRNKLALGEDRRGENENAANMKVLSYNKELEFVAQCYANACRNMGNHDKCRRTREFDFVGQNMFGLEAIGNFDFADEKWIKDAINGWYEEIVDTNKPSIDNFGQSYQVIGHFTQVVWADTTHVGCGRTVYSRGRSTLMSIYCNYGPAGNFLKSSVYIRGTPCSQCGSLKCNNQYKGLCGQVEDLKNDKWIPPFGTERDSMSRSSELVGSLFTYIFLFVIVKCN